MGFQRTEAELEFDNKVARILQSEKARREVLEQEERTTRKQAIVLQTQNETFRKWFKDRDCPLPDGCKAPNFHVNQASPRNAVDKQKKKTTTTVNND